MTTTHMTTPDVTDLPFPGLAGVPTLEANPDGTLTKDTRKDYTSDQEVRWCPGCGDYAILAAIQGFLPDLGLKRENIVFISGIGCSSRFPYYLDTYGMHSIHGRAPAIATGIATTRKDLSVWVITGDGDALSIGGNHLIHAMRRNINLKILLFNNRIYGLTKGQYSPTSETGKITKSTPVGSIDHPFNPVSLALGAEATFVARTIDSDRTHLTHVLAAAAAHRGTALVEIYQNCPIFNDGAFDHLKNTPRAGTTTSTDANGTEDPEDPANNIIALQHGQPIRFGTPTHDGTPRYAVVRGTNGGVEIIDTTQTPERATDTLTHDAHNPNPAVAFALSRLTDTGTIHRAPIGIFRNITRPTYDDQARTQITTATKNHPNPHTALTTLINGTDTWTIL